MRVREGSTKGVMSTGDALSWLRDDDEEDAEELKKEEEEEPEHEPPPKGEAGNRDPNIA